MSGPAPPLSLLVPASPDPATPSAPPSEGISGDSDDVLKEPAPDALTVLVVDDEPSNLASLERIFLRESMRVLTAIGAREALELLRKHRVQVVLTDLMMPGINGLELLRTIKEISPDAEVLLMTAYATIETAVQAIREGAYDFIEKPLKRAAVVKSVRMAAERNALLLENRSLKQEIRRLSRREIVGQSTALRRVLDVAHQVAPSSATVLLLGESGTGKELLARAIHERSPRAKKPFVAVNCAAIPESILEAELFGHERGAFTGATARREGRFAKADTGTLFLDEIGEMPLDLQAKLLRALQEKTFERVGGNEPIAMDVRLVAATHRDLLADVAAGKFREDLYYRLNVVHIEMPPLRARSTDVLLLADHFLQKFAAENHKAIDAFSDETRSRLTAYRWPGNVRELANVIERAVVLAQYNQIDSAEIPNTPLGASKGSLGIAIPGSTMAEIEKFAILNTLEATGGSTVKAAEILDISVRTIQYRLHEYGMVHSQRSHTRRASSASLNGGS